MHREDRTGCKEREQVPFPARPRPQVHFLIFLLCIVMFFSKEIVFYFFFLFDITSVFFYSYGDFVFFFL